MTRKEHEALTAAVAENWQTEMTGFYTYQGLALAEAEPQRRNAFRGLAAAEKHHADLWSARYHQLAAGVLVYKGDEHGDAAKASTLLSGSTEELRLLEIEESRDIARYSRQLAELAELNDDASLKILTEVLEDEREHYRTLKGLLCSRPADLAAPESAQVALDRLLARRKNSRHQTAGWIGDAIYGINDGLGSIFGIVSGVAGATLGNAHFVLIAGLAGMVASALSMGSGAYLAAKSEREIYEAAFALERESVEQNESEAREILSLSYQVKGIPPVDADRWVDHLAGDQTQLVQALARERLNTDADALRRPGTAAIAGALSTAVGAFVPIIPFFFLAGLPAVIVAAVISLAAHFAVGAAKSLITIRSWWSSGMEMTLVGAVEGLATYFIGVGLGHMGS